MTESVIRRSTRFYVDPPYAGETISFAVERALRYHRISKEYLLERIYNWAKEKVPPMSEIDWDNPPEVLLKGLAYAFYITPSQLGSHAIVDGPLLLHRNARNAACPMCLWEDKRSGLVPYNRIEWVSIFVTFCYKHGCPLVPWVHASKAHALRLGREKNLEDRYKRSLKLSFLAEKRWNGLAISTRLIAWERGFRAALSSSDNPMLPVRKIVREQIEMIVLLGTLRHAKHIWAPAGGLVAGIVATGGSNMHWSFSRGERRDPSTSGQGWEAFRVVSSPANRRAAFFLTAGCYEPNWPLGSLVVGPWFGKLKTRSADWWQLIVRSRFGDLPEDLSRLDALARSAEIQGYQPCR